MGLVRTSLSGTDAMLGEMTIAAAAIIDPAYAETMNIAMNWLFIAVSVFLLTFIGAWVTEKIVEPRLGSYNGDQKEELKGLEPLEKKGLVWAVIAAVVGVVLALLLVLPPNAPLRGTEGDTMAQIVQSPFMSSLVPIIAIIFFIPGIAYGIVTKSIRMIKMLQTKCRTRWLLWVHSSCLHSQLDSSLHFSTKRIWGLS